MKNIAGLNIIKPGNIGSRVSGVIFSGGFIWFLLTRINIEESITLIGKYKFEILPLSFAAVFLTYVLDGICQYALLNSARIHPVVFVTRVLQAQLFSLFLPGKIGDTSLLFFFRKEPKGKIIKTYLFSKLITVSIAFFLAVPLFSFLTGVHKTIWYTASLLLIALVSAGYFNIRVYWKMITRFLPGKFKFENIYIVNPSLPHFLTASMFTIARFFLMAIASYSLLIAGGMHVAFSSVISIAAVVLLLGLVPLTPMGIGVVELSSVYLYGLFGVEASAAITIPLIGRLFQFTSLGIFALSLVFLPIEKDN